MSSKIECCKKCKLRTESGDCHSTCPSYISEKASLNALREMRNMKSQRIGRLDCITKDGARKARKKARR